MHVREHDIEVVGDPCVLIIVRGHELDRQRAVGAVVLPDESVGLEPAGKSRLGHQPRVGLGRFIEKIARTCHRERALGHSCHVWVEVQTHPRLELVDAQPRGRGASLRNGLHDVIGRGLDVRAVAEVDAPHRLRSVRLHRNDARRAMRVIDLAPDLLVLDQPADRHHSVRRRHERTVRLARRALRVLLEADVEPDGRVERHHLVQQQVRQLGVEGVGLGLVDEVAVLDAPGRDGVGDAADHLAHRVLALGACSASRGSTSGRRCWWRSATRTRGTPRPSARTRGRPCRGSARCASPSRRSRRGRRHRS